MRLRGKGNAYPTKRNHFINMIQMSELAVTFQGMELPQFPPVKSMRVENARQ